MWYHFFPLLSPKNSESLKILDIRLWEVGAKRPLNGTSKVNKHTDIWTNRLIESIGPEGRCFENSGKNIIDEKCQIKLPYENCPLKKAWWKKLMKNVGKKNMMINTIWKIPNEKCPGMELPEQGCATGNWNNWHWGIFLGLLDCSWTVGSLLTDESEMGPNMGAD